MTATPEEIRAWAAGLSEARLRCRMHGHDPLHHTVQVVTLEGGERVYEQVEVCTHRCGTWWNYFISMQTGQVIGRRRIHYKAGYLAKGTGTDSVQVRKGFVRLESIQRRIQRGN